jgi:hypothetical protein
MVYFILKVKFLVNIFSFKIYYMIVKWETIEGCLTYTKQLRINGIKVYMTDCRMYINEYITVTHKIYI